LEITLKEEVIEHLGYKAILAYVAIQRRGSGQWTTPHLAACVNLTQNKIMQEGLEQLSEAHPELLVKVKGKGWSVGGEKKQLQILDCEDTRRRELLDDLKKFWEHYNPTQFTMNAADGNVVRIFLRQHKDWNRDMWRRALNNRGRSEVNHSEAIYRWMSRLPEYLESPVDRYGKPMQHGGGELGKAISREVGNSAARQAVISGR